MRSLHPALLHTTRHYAAWVSFVGLPDHPLPPTCILPWLKKAPPRPAAAPPVNRTFSKVTKREGMKPELSAWKIRSEEAGAEGVGRKCEHSSFAQKTGG